MKSLTLILAFALFAQPATAALIDLGTITRDTDQGIEWLDPTETVGLSLAEALALFPGWELATHSQVCGFVAQAESAFPICGGSALQITGLRPWSQMFGLWGQTVDVTFGNDRGLAAVSDTYRHNWLVPKSGTPAGVYIPGDPTLALGQGEFEVGIFLVRAIPAPHCSDGIDNDGDGLIDAGEDPGCSDASDTSEQDPNLPCDDGLDNDADNLIDLQDPACKDPSWSRENAQCQDGLDNDNNDGIDFDGGASIFGQMIEPPDPQCSSFWDNREAVNPPATCGLGPELVLLTPLMMLAHRRRQRRQRR
jgi:hypothetical protein